MKKNQINIKMMLVDLQSGNYTQKHTGYETLNLKQNDDGMFYGFVPDDDHVDITNLDPEAKDYVEGVLVIYVKAIGKSTDRRIVAYCKSATVFRKPQPGEEKSRYFKDSDGTQRCASYSVMSDNMVNLEYIEHPFVIETSKYNPYMFRGQRTFLKEYPELKEKIISYIYDLESYDYQNQVHSTPAATLEYAQNYENVHDEISAFSGGQYVKRNPSIAKRVLESNNYRCAIDSSHLTFQTRSDVPYMEAHHLIPCTVSNSQRFQEKSKLDREENIVCICPNCHRAIHYGNDDTQEKYLKILYNKQKDKLDRVGLQLSFAELLNLYKG